MLERKIQAKGRKSGGADPSKIAKSRASIQFHVPGFLLVLGLILCAFNILLTFLLCSPPQGATLWEPGGEEVNLHACRRTTFVSLMCADDMHRTDYSGAMGSVCNLLQPSSSCLGRLSGQWIGSYVGSDRVAALSLCSPCPAGEEKFISKVSSVLASPPSPLHVTG